mmetsp:Transcript_35087/g.69366  ORF Transcript_35087/g.69366 Transcript_35087/m.69366 type:complete len:91 (+) Transcript_35087:53-325(+)|eukprot:CAMPEP_0172710096 /NCGR_PEP_ID=MMETSP1074-20121228/55454_1 /TAXON_ID=2916 /ORGANISM="Ceratium fusus, Strain PA161109" /LENGTH=90 /DNA_ID=CAMNT_0013533437 /DNA_START=58 /DNA_END=330 /DNA_ORIENTATION=+
MDENAFDNLRNTLKEALSRADEAIESKRGDAQRLVQKMTQDKAQLNAEWEQVNGERKALAEAHADVNAKLEEVGKMKAELLAQKKAMGLR